MRGQSIASVGRFTIREPMWGSAADESKSVELAFRDSPTVNTVIRFARAEMPDLLAALTEAMGA